jgi:hypothetical protein
LRKIYQITKLTIDEDNDESSEDNSSSAASNLLLSNENDENQNLNGLPDRTTSVVSIPDEANADAHRNTNTVAEAGGGVSYNRQFNYAVTVETKKDFEDL